MVLSQYAEPHYALRLFGRGSGRRAYLLKERVEDVDAASPPPSRTVADGRLRGRPRRSWTRSSWAVAPTEPSPLDELTPRERDVLREMAEGKNNAAIAASLVLTEHSVEKVIGSIFSKLGLTWEHSAHKRVKAVLFYLAEQ